MGSISRDICLFFNFPTPSNTSGYGCFNLTALVVTTAMLIPTFNTPNSVAVVFPRSDTPLPLITRTSALVDLSQTPIVHLKLPFIGNGLFDAYEYSFLSGEAICDSHLTPFAFSCSHVPSQVNSIAVGPRIY